MASLGENIGSFYLDGHANMAAFGSEAKKGAEDAGKSVGDTLGSQVISTLKKFAAPIAAALTVGGIVKFAKSSIEAYEGVTKAAMATQRQLGGTVGDASRLNFAFRQTGVDSGAATVGLKRFSQWVTNSKEAAKVLGFAVKDSSGHVKTMGELLPKVADKFKNMNDGAEKTALAVKLFGRSGTELLPFLNKGSAGIADLTKKAQAFGFVVGDEDVAAVKKNLQVHREWTAALEGLKITIGQRLMPVIEAVLLPVLEKFTIWIVTKGIPLVNKIGDSISEWAHKHAPAFKAAMADVQAEAEKLWKSIQKAYEQYLPTFKRAWVDVKDGISVGLEWLKKAYDFIDTHFSKESQKDFLEVVAAVAVLKKTGVFSVGVKLIGAAQSLIQGGEIQLSGAVAAAAMRTAMLSGGATAASLIAEAMAGGAGAGAAGLPVASTLFGDPAATALEAEARARHSRQLGGQGNLSLAGLGPLPLTAILATVAAAFFESKWAIQAGLKSGARAGAPTRGALEDFKKAPGLGTGAKLAGASTPFGVGAFELTRLIDSGEWSKLYEGFMNNFGSKVTNWFKVDAKNAVSEGVGAITSKWNELSGFVSSSFDSWWQTHGDSVKQIWQTLKGTAALIWSQIEAIFTSPAIQDTFRILWNEAKLIFETGLNILIAVAKGAWDLLVLIFNVAVQTLLFTARQLWDALVFLFNLGLDLVTGHWHQMWEDTKNFFIQTFNNIRDFLGGTLSAIGSFFVNVWNGTIRPILDALGGFISANVVPAFRAGVDAISAAWSGIRDAARVPVNFVIHVLNDGLINPFNSIANAVGIKTRIGTINGLAEGGHVRGFGTETSDSIPAWLSDYEYVIPARTVHRFGVGFFDRLVGKGGPRADRPGDGSQGLAFAAGGVVGAIVSGLTGAGSALWDLITNPKLLTGPVNALLDNVPGSGLFRDLAIGTGKQLVEGLAVWIGKQVGAGGDLGGNMGKAQAMVKAAAGKPYGWAQAGPGSYDCCIAAGARVYGPDGPRPIEDIRPGDRVYSYVDKVLVTNTVVAAWQSINQAVFRVRTRSRSITASANHPFLRLVQDGYEHVEHWESAEWAGLPVVRLPRRDARCTISTCAMPVHANGMCAKHQARWYKHGDPRITLSKRARFEIQWARLDELSEGDILVQARRLPTDAKPLPVLSDGTSVDSDVAWLIGALVGDGTVRKGQVRLCMYGDDRDYAASIIAARWAGKLTYGQSYGLISSNSNLATALIDLGMCVLGPDKRIPEAVWTWSDGLQRAFLEGYCDADGHHPNDQKRHGERTYSSASRELIEDVRALHICFGDPVSNICVNERKHLIVIKGKTVKNARSLYTFAVWPNNGHGEASLRNNPGVAAWLANDDFTLARVLRIETKGSRDTWDLNIEGAHNFIVDGVVVHNSGIVSMAYNVIKGTYPFMHTFSTMGEAPYFPHPGPGVFTAGWAQGGEQGGGDVGHTAAQLGNLMFESTGSRGVHITNVTPLRSFAHMGHYARGGRVARGSMLPVASFDNGGFLPPHSATVAVNNTRKWESVGGGMDMASAIKTALVGITVVMDGQAVGRIQARSADLYARGG